MNSKAMPSSAWGSPPATLLGSPRREGEGRDEGVPLGGTLSPSPGARWMSPTFVVCCSSGAWSVRRNKGCQPSLLFTHKVHTNKDRSYRLESTASPGCTTSPSGPWLSHATVSSHVSAALSEACCLTYLLLLTGPLPKGPIRWGFWLTVCDLVPSGPARLTTPPYLKSRAGPLAPQPPTYLG